MASITFTASNSTLALEATQEQVEDHLSTLRQAADEQLDALERLVDLFGMQVGWDLEPGERLR